MKNDSQDEEIVLEPEQEGSEEDLEAMESRAGAKADKLKRELEACKAERQEYLDGWQRAKADYVNALKRFEEERGTLSTKGIRKAAEAFIPALDSLERAEAHGEIPEGFAGVAKQLHEAARSLTLERFGAVGEPFEPALHEALGQDPARSKEEDHSVSTVLESGWKQGEAVVRPAKVRIYHYEG